MNPDRQNPGFARRREIKPFLRGFSLLELVIVIMIVGIMAAVALPRFGETLGRNRVELAANRVEHDLELAQRTARRASSTQRVTFDTVTDSYTLPNVDHLDHAGEDYAVTLADVPYEVDLISVDFDGNSYVDFDGFGVPTSGGTVVLAAGGYKVAITLESGTGKTLKEITKADVLTPDAGSLSPKSGKAKEIGGAGGTGAVKP